MIRELQGGAFSKDMAPERRHRPIQGSECPLEHTMGIESRDDAFKKGASFAAAGLSAERTCFHPGHPSPPPNAAPRLPR